MTEQVTFLTRSGQATTQSSPIGGDAFEPDQDGPDMMKNTNLPAERSMQLAQPARWACTVAVFWCEIGRLGRWKVSLLSVGIQ